MADTPMFLTGLIPVEAAVSAGFRTVHRIDVDDGIDWRKTEPLRRVAKKRGLDLNRRSRAELDELAGGSDHGGVVAEVGPRRTMDLKELVAGTGAGKPMLVMLDGVEDPYNFAHAVRSVWAAGCTGLIVRPRNWYEAASLIGRASAGATELVPTAVVASAEEVVDQLQAMRLTVVAADDGDDAEPLFDTDLTGSLCLLVGGEHRGIQKAALRKADRRIYIPYGRPFPLSLGTVAAASAIAFEVVRQRSTG